MINESELEVMTKRAQANEKHIATLEQKLQTQAQLEQQLTTLKMRDKLLQLLIEDCDAQMEGLTQRVLELEAQVASGKMF